MRSQQYQLGGLCSALLGLLLPQLMMQSNAYAQAQAWPSKPIRWVLPSAAGSAPDIIARLLSEKLVPELGQQVVIDNRPGAAGNIAAQAVARAAPDGYTYLFGQASTLAVNPYTFKSTGFDADRDFAAVISIGVSPFMIGVNPELKVNTVAQLVALAKAQPGKLSFATSASRNLSHITGEMLKSVTGIDMLHVPYKGSGAVYPDLMAGRVTLLTDVMGSALGQVKGGKVRALGITSLQRSRTLPDVPTIAEQGYPGFEFGTWFGFFAPAATPPDAVKKLEAAVLQALQTEAVKERLNAVGAQLLPGPGAAFAKWYLNDVERWAKLVREGRLQPID